MTDSRTTMRPCDAPCGMWCGCKEIDCEECALAPVILPGEPGRDEESKVPDMLDAPDPDVRVSQR